MNTNKRRAKLFSSMFDALFRVLDEETELFWKERPFLDDFSAERKILSFPEIKKELKIQKDHLLDKLHMIIQEEREEALEKAKRSQQEIFAH